MCIYMYAIIVFAATYFIIYFVLYICIFVDNTCHYNKIFTYLLYIVYERVLKKFHDLSTV